MLEERMKSKTTGANDITADTEGVYGSIVDEHGNAIRNDCLEKQPPKEDISNIELSYAKNGQELNRRSSAVSIKSVKFKRKAQIRAIERREITEEEKKEQDKKTQSPLIDEKTSLPTEQTVPIENTEKNDSTDQNIQNVPNNEKTDDKHVIENQ